MASDDSIWHTWQTAPSNGWSGWAPFHSGADRLRNLVVGQNADGRLEIFARGADNAPLIHAATVSAGFTAARSS